MCAVIYVIAILLLGILIVLVAMYTNRDRINEQEDDRREFNDFDQLVSFIRKKYECKQDHQVPLYGFVTEDSSAYINGITDLNSAIDVSVVLILSQESKIVNASCGDILSSFKKGDFVAVIPFYNTRHRFWYYVLIAKLKPVYLGNKKGFLIFENFVRNIEN